MNRGEGLKYAAHAKSGQINLFKEQQKKTNKKFSYKGRGQAFTVRKIQTKYDFPGDDHNTHAAPQSAAATASNKKTTTKTQAGGSAKNRKAPNEQKNKHNQRDFVKKNNSTSTTGKGKQNAKPSAAGGSTVTLTQEQLNAILATIGKAAGRGAIPNISLDNLDINIETKENPQVRNQASEEESHVRPKAQIEKYKTDDKTEKYKDDDPATNSSAPSSTSAKPPVNQMPSEQNEHHHQSRSGNLHGSNDYSRTLSSNNGTPSSNLGFGDVSSIIGHNERELREKKNHQWKKELDEQMALKHQQQELRGGRGRDTDHQTWGPWGQPGSGAPQGQKISRDTYSNVNSGLSAVTVADQNDGLPNVTKSAMSSRNTPGDVSSSLGKIATQRYTPAAMRSSFIIGGDSVDSYNMTIKEKEKKQWIEDLEHQRLEAKQRREQEKQKHREFDDRLTAHWAEQVTSPRSRPVDQFQGKPAMSRVDDIEGKQKTKHSPESTVHTEASVQRHRSADAVPIGRDNENDLGLTSHTRPSGLLVDPAEAERREQQRKKHMEHMLAVKMQVEERQRQKREVLEAKKREEAEEERKLMQERDALQMQFDLEKEKQRKKEEGAAAKQKALLESVQAAYESAQQAKHQKRVQRLEQQGHNVSNLRHNWEVNHVSPVTSPRPQASRPLVRHSPHLEPLPTTTTNASRTRHSCSLEPSPTGSTPISSTQDAATSPVFDQAVQTDFQFPPSDMVLERVFEIQREDSTGIEYKPNKEEKRKPDGQKKAKGQNRGKLQGEEKSQRTIKSKSQQEVSEEETKSQRTNSVKSRPVWGKTNQKKKKMGNTEKDVTGQKRQREERRRQRMEEMIAAQERNAPKRLAEKKKAVSVPQSRTSSAARTNSTQETRGQTMRAATDTDLRQEKKKTLDMWTRDREVDLPPSPPLRSGDFVPFLRNDEELNERSIPGSPDSRYSQHSRTRGRESQRVTPKFEKTRSSSINKKDPLLNPERLKDSNLRQEKILEQLSNLRQGLMMKQRELDLGLSSPLVM